MMIDETGAIITACTRGKSVKTGGSSKRVKSGNIKGVENFVQLLIIILKLWCIVFVET